MAEAERRQILRKRYSNRSKRSIIGTPPPVKGRRHETIQTDRYLEELFIKPNEYSVECQTDLYLYEIPESPYIPTKDGIDVSTEIDDNDLIDFNNDIEPILDALVEMTMSQAIHEFICEEELAELQKEKEQYIAFKKSQIDESKRLEMDQDLQLQLTNNSNTQLNSQTTDKINAAKLLQNYVSTLLPDVLVSLNDDISQRNIEDIDEKFTPWLANEIASDVGQLIDSRESLENLIRHIVETRAEDYLQQNGK